MSVEVGTVHILCDVPECRMELPVVVTAEMESDVEGQQYLNCDPDMSELWSHRWSHHPDYDGDEDA